MILLTGRFAGKKAVIVKSYEEGTKVYILKIKPQKYIYKKYNENYYKITKKERKFPHCLVAGIEKYPR